MEVQPTDKGHHGLNFATDGTATEETIAEKILPLRMEKLIRTTCDYQTVRMSSTLLKPSLVSCVEITWLHLSFLLCFFLTNPSYRNLSLYRHYLVSQMVIA